MRSVFTFMLLIPLAANAACPGPSITISLSEGNLSKTYCISTEDAAALQKAGGKFIDPKADAAGTLNAPSDRRFAAVADVLIDALNNLVRSDVEERAIRVAPKKPNFVGAK